MQLLASDDLKCILCLVVLVLNLSTFSSLFSRVTILSVRQCGGMLDTFQHLGDQLPIQLTSGAQHHPSLLLLLLSSSMMTKTTTKTMMTTTAMRKVEHSGMMPSKLRVRVVNNNSNSLYNNSDSNKKPGEVTWEGKVHFERTTHQCQYLSSCTPAPPLTLKHSTDDN